MAGLDEAGRGPLAGPVMAAAVILDPKRIPKGLDDSKRLSHDEREELFEIILKKALAVSFASCSAETIDRTDIRKASLEAMRRAACGLALKPQLALADGLDVPPGLVCEGQAVVKGDQRSQSIAAASIVAKVMRDRMMAMCGTIHVDYGFEAAYGLRHRAAPRGDRDRRRLRAAAPAHLLAVPDRGGGRACRLSMLRAPRTASSLRAREARRPCPPRLWGRVGKRVSSAWSGPPSANP